MAEAEFFRERDGDFVRPSFSASICAALDLRNAHCGFVHLRANCTGDLMELRVK